MSVISTNVVISDLVKKSLTPSQDDLTLSQHISRPIAKSQRVAGCRFYSNVIEGGGSGSPTVIKLYFTNFAIVLMNAKNI